MQQKKTDFWHGHPSLYAWGYLFTGSCVKSHITSTLFSTHFFLGYLTNINITLEMVKNSVRGHQISSVSNEKRFSCIGKSQRSFNKKEQSEPGTKREDEYFCHFVFFPIPLLIYFTTVL